MSKVSLSDRRKALEDRFFQDLEAQKLSDLRNKLAEQRQAAELRSTSGIDDDAVIDALVKLDVGVSDLAALSIVPLVQVAWADGSVTDAERKAVLDAAHSQGLSAGTHSHQLLEGWLSEKPSQDLFEAWHGYVEALRQHLPPSELSALRDSIQGLAHDVASAAGGILGIGAVTHAEKVVLEAIGDAFDE